MNKIINIVFTLIVATCLTSCIKINIVPGDSSEYDPTAYVEFIAGFLNEQDKFVDQSYNLKVNGKDVCITAAKMEDVTKNEDYAEIYKSLKNTLSAAELDSEFKICRYVLGILKEGEKVECGLRTYSAREDRPEEDEINIMDTFGLIANGVFTNSCIKMDGGVHLGIYSDVLSEWCSTMTLPMNITYTVNRIYPKK